MDEVETLDLMWFYPVWTLHFGQYTHYLLCQSSEIKKKDLPGGPCTHTVKPVLSGHSKIDKTKFLMVNGSLMKV